MEGAFRGRRLSVVQCRGFLKCRIEDAADLAARASGRAVTAVVLPDEEPPEVLDVLEVLPLVPLVVSLGQAAGRLAAGQEPLVAAPWRSRRASAPPPDASTEPIGVPRPAGARLQPTPAVHRTRRCTPLLPVVTSAKAGYRRLQRRLDRPGSDAVGDFRLDGVDGNRRQITGAPRPTPRVSGGYSERRRRRHGTWAWGSWSWTLILGVVFLAEIYRPFSAAGI